MNLDRRAFLALGASSVLRGQSSMPPPPKAKITSAAMLWTLDGAFEQRVKTVAEAGVQNVGLLDEYAQWDAAAVLKAKRYMESFGMIAETLLATPSWETRSVSLVNPVEREAFLVDLKRALEVAKKLDTPYVVVVSGKEARGYSREQQYASLLEGAKRAGAMAAAAEIMILIAPLSNKTERKNVYLTGCAEGVKLVKEVDSPHVRLMASTFEEYAQTGNLKSMNEALEYSSVVTLADAPGRVEPGTGSLDAQELYRALQKSGYSHTVAMEYKPKGNPVASLKRTVDRFRAAVKERGALPAGLSGTTEGSLV